MNTRVALLLVLLSLILAMPVAAGPKTCATIQSGEITYPAGHYWVGRPVSRSFDAYGFNYQMQYFQGWFVNSYLGFWGLPPYTGDYEAYIAANPDAASLGDPADPSSFWALKDLQLIITWSTDYRSRSDCDGDGWFDRHYGSETYLGTNAWYTNRVNGMFAGDSYLTFSLVEAAPADAMLVDGFWYTADGREFGYAVDDVVIGMAGTLDIVAGDGIIYRGMPGTNRYAHTWWRW